jgi:hypothetical protein
LKNKEEILEFFQKNFKEGNKISLVKTFGIEFPFIERKKTTEEIYKIIEERNEMKLSNSNRLEDKFNVILPFVGYLPGSGKSRNATELTNVLQKFDKEKELNLLENAIQILICFGNGYKIIHVEKDNIITSFSIRLLLGYFGFGDYTFKKAIKLIHQKISNIFEMDIEYAMDIIIKDLKDKENPYFIVSIDEFQMIVIIYF